MRYAFFITLVAGEAFLWGQTGVAYPDLAPVDSAIQSVMTQYSIPGASLAVAYQGKLVYARGYGLQDRDRPEAVQPDSLFRLASVSKTITAIAALRALDQGKLRLDDLAFAQVLRDFTPPSGTKVAGYDSVTLRHLLQHTAGFPAAANLGAPAFVNPIRTAFGITAVPTPEQMVRYQLGQAMFGPAGQQYEYSNLGSVAVARVVERAVGKPYEQYVKDDVMKPLGISEARIAAPFRRDRAPNEVRYHVAVGTARSPSVFPGEGPEEPPYAISIPSYEGAGGWAIRAPDLARLINRLAGTNSLLTPAAFGEMVKRPAAPVSQTGNFWYGLGAEVTDQGNGRYFMRHSGSLPGTNTVWIHYHPVGLTIVVLFNMRDGEEPGAANSLASSRLAALTANVLSPARLPTADLSPLYFPSERARTSAGGIVNAASYRGGSVAPGEIVTIFGEQMGAAALTTARVESNRLVTALNGTRVLFDGVPAALVYASAGQVSAIVPYAVAGKTSTQVEVERDGIRSLPVAVAVTAVAPALFTANSSGSGPAAAVLYKEQRVAVLFGTGEGVPNPLPLDGELATGQLLPRPIASLKVLVAGREVPVLYAGAAPGLTAGLLQINVEIPADLVSQGILPVVLQVGDARSPDGVTLSFQ